MQPDNNNQQFMAPVDPSQVLPPTPPPHPVISVPVSPPQNNINYAGISTRFFASLVDGVILGVLTFIVTTVTTLLTAGLVGGTDVVSISSIIQMILQFALLAVQIAYPIYFIGARGQTPGKMAMKIKVIKAETGEVPGFVAAFLRETIGKILSSILLLGYIVAIRDPKKQTWHDRIAGTVVVKI